MQIDEILKNSVTLDYRPNFLSYHIKQSDKTLLDVSCGKGVYLRYWKWKGLSVVGTEETEPLVNYNKKMGLDCLQVNLNEKVLRLPFPDKSIDVATCTEVLEHIAYPKVVVSELMRVAKELVMITTPVGRSYDSPDHINHWNSYFELEQDIIPDGITAYSIYEIVTKPQDWPMNQRSFVVIINLRQQ